METSNPQRPTVGIWGSSVTYEDVIVRIAPSSVGVCLFFAFASQFRHRVVLFRSSPLLWAKIVASLALVVCQSAAMRHSQRNDAITSLELIASINVGAMAYFAHIYAAQSSGLLANYLLFTSFVDFYKSRIHLLQPELALVASFGFAAACLRLALLLLEELPKNGPPSADEQASKNTEPNRGWFCRSVFIYLDPSFITNLCDRLRNQDSAELSPQLSSAVLQKTVRERWTRLESKRYRHRLIIACISAWRWEISALCLLFLTTALFSAAPAFFIEQIVRFVERDQVPARSLLLLGMQLDLSCMALFVYFGMHVAQSIRSYLQSDLLLKVRGGLMGMVMEKTHRLTAKDAQTSGDTRINTEIELGCEKLSFFLRESVALFDLIIGLSGLFWRIGTPSIGILCAILLTHLLGRRLLALRQVIHLQCEEIKRARISKTLEVLKQLPGLKLLGLGPTVREHLHRLRLKELEASKPYYIYSALFFAVQVFSQHIVTIVTVTFMYFWGESDERMATAQFFPILSIIQILTLDIPRTIHLQGFALDIFFHFEHVQRFLLLSERQEFRKTLSYSGASDDQSTKTPMRGSEGRKVVVKFENATFGPVGKETPVLSNVNFSLLEGSISAAVGQTGCGKSTLFHGILGETKMTSGRLYANKRGIAFCSTQVWLQNVSIRENILGGLPFDAVRYQAALQSCQLNDDLAQLPGGDGFKVGPDGLNLSGGQRQKVSLARGVFLQCEVTILDDVFSSLDHRTALTILNALCGENGLLRRPQSTVLLAGHLPEILDIVDQVLVFDGQGNVSLDSVEFRKPGRRQSMVDLLASGPICVSEARESKEKAAIRRAMALHPGQGAQLENYVYLERSGSIKRMSTFFSYMGKLGCITVVIFAILVASSEDAVFLSLQMWARDPFGNCFWYIGIVLSTLVASFALFVSNWFLWCKFGVDTGMRLHDDVLDIAMRATYGHITSVDTTSFISWFDQHSHVVSHFLPGSFFRVFNMGYSALSTSIITTCFCSNYLLATMPFFCYTVHYVYRLHSRISEHIAGHDSRHKGLLDTFFKETSHGILHMRAFGSQDKNMMQGYQLVDKSQDALRLSPYLPMWLGLVTGLFTTTIALLLVSVIVWGGGSVSAATAAQSFLLLKNIQRTCIESIMAWSRWSTRSTVLLQLEDLRSATPQELNPSSSPELPPSWPLGDVELSNVSARYSATDPTPVIRDMSLVIEPGERISLIGRSSSGKTSLMLTMLGVLQYTGVVEIDGIDIETVTPDVLRSRVITMTQDAVHFKDTVRANLNPFDMNEEVKDDILAKMLSATKDNMLRGVLQQLGLWNKLSAIGGLDAMLQEVGYSKSELQLFSVARGVVRRLQTGINFILMDEATSKLDPLLEDATHQFMEQVFQGCTVIIISHRQEVIQTTDCALRLDQGELINVEIPSNPLTWLGAALPPLPASDRVDISVAFDFSGFSPRSSVEPEYVSDS